MHRLRPVAALAASVVLLAAAPGGADDDPGVIPFELETGQTVVVSTGPIRNLICDDGSLVEPVFTGQGVALKGRRAGTTLCSYQDAMSMRRVLRVVVVAPPAGSRSAPQGGAPAPGK
jgi:hypothetical protein